MKLSKYLELTDQSVRSFSKKCELTPAIIHFAVQGDRSINLKTALIIEKMTNGDVSPIDLCNEEFQEKTKRLKSPFKKLT